MSTPDDPAEQRDVLSSLPRSRRQRPSARREAARAGSRPVAGVAKAKATTTGAKKPRAKKPAVARSKAPAKPRAGAGSRAAARPRKPAPAKRSSIPPAGYATPRDAGGHGSADPGAVIAGLVRGVLRRLPF